jgi:hypothetical protein
LNGIEGSRSGGTGRLGEEIITDARAKVKLS